MKEYKILTINLGSTSTKIAVYNNDKENFTVSINHSINEISNYDSIWDQYEFRKEKILNELEKRNISLKDMDCISSRGGTIKPIVGGIYLISLEMIDDAQSGKYGYHVCSLGMLIAMQLGKKYNIPAITVDPPAIDELCNYARYTGLPEINRKSSFHSLNQKATARKTAKDLGEKYEDVNLIVCHLGGGISVAAHRKGKVIDVNNALDGEGPMSPERAGTIPAGDLVKMCFSGKYNQEEMLLKLNGKGGLIAHLGTTSGLEIVQRIENGDSKAKEIFETMAYQISKQIGSCASALSGDVDAIVLTGSLSYSERLVKIIKERTKFIANIMVYPGQNEMKSLAEGALRYLRGYEKIREY